MAVLVGTPFDQYERLAKLAEKPRMDHQASQKRPEFVEMHCSDFENRVFETDTELHPQR